jgi:hypothetical protein
MGGHDTQVTTGCAPWPLKRPHRFQATETLAFHCFERTCGWSEDMIGLIITLIPLSSTVFE